MNKMNNHKLTMKLKFCHSHSRKLTCFGHFGLSGKKLGRALYKSRIRELRTYTKARNETREVDMSWCKHVKLL